MSAKRLNVVGRVAEKLANRSLMSNYINSNKESKLTVEEMDEQQQLLKQQMKHLKQQEKHLAEQMRQLKQHDKQMVNKKQSRKQQGGGLLEGLSAELKYRLLEQVRRSSSNYELWLCEWYFGRTSQAGAEQLLLGNARNRPGAFLFTEGRGSRKGEFVLSVLTAVAAGDGSASSGMIVKHYRLRAYYGYSLSNLRSFASLEHLIDYYSRGRSTIKLGRACVMPLTHHYAKK